MQAHRFGWLFGAAALITANAASAQDCAKDADCGDGYVCKTGMNAGCAEKPCPPDDPKCNNLPPDCAPTEYHYCEAKPCSADSDCPDTMVCHSETYSTCSGGGATPEPAPACKPGADCPMQDPNPLPADSCTEMMTVSACTPRWVLPCTHAADCGEGFNCKEQISYTCAGSAPAAGGGSAGSADGGMPAADPVPPQEMCTSEPSGMFYCELKDLPCATDADCASGLECVDMYNAVTCASPPQGTPKSGSGSAGAGAPEDAGAGDQAIDPCAAVDTTPKKACAPHNYYGNGLGIADSAAGGVAGDTKSGAAAGEAVPPQTPNPTTGSAHHSAAGPSSNGDNSTTKASGGCAVSAPSGSGAGMLGFLSVLGLSVLALRRRK